MSFSFKTWSQSRLPLFEARLLAQFADARPEALLEACRYPLHTGGKRMRPLLCFAAAEGCGASASVALDAAIAVELLHTYSLVHDDLPSMDNDDERRGRPTVHKAYGDGVAVLVGDALLTEAFATLGSHPEAGKLVTELARSGGASGMIAGQAYDIGMDGVIDDVQRLRTLHRLKTGALIGAAVRMGAICGNANTEHLRALTQYADQVGLAFQVHDDVLDADQDQKIGGPPSFVKLLGVSDAKALARTHMQAALDALATVPHPEALAALAVYAVERQL